MVDQKRDELARGDRLASSAVPVEVKPRGELAFDAPIALLDYVRGAFLRDGGEVDARQGVGAGVDLCASSIFEDQLSGSH